MHSIAFLSWGIRNRNRIWCHWRPYNGFTIPILFFAKITHPEILFMSLCPRPIWTMRVKMGYARSRSKFWRRVQLFGIRGSKYDEIGMLVCLFPHPRTPCESHKILLSYVVWRVQMGGVETHSSNCHLKTWYSWFWQKQRHQPHRRTKAAHLFYQVSECFSQYCKWNNVSHLGFSNAQVYFAGVVWAYCQVYFLPWGVRRQKGKEKRNENVTNKNPIIKSWRLRYGGKVARWQKPFHRLQVDFDRFLSKTSALVLFCIILVSSAKLCIFCLLLHHFAYLPTHHQKENCNITVKTKAEKWAKMARNGPKRAENKKENDTKNAKTMVKKGPKPVKRG